MSSRPDLMAGLRLRVPLVFVIPVVAILVIAAVAIGFSQVLLNLPKEAATIVALAFALNILGACAVLALRKRTDAATMGELFVVVSYPVVIGVVLAIVGFGTGQNVAEKHGEETKSGGVAESIVAASVAFNTDSLTLTAGEETQLELKNDDSVEHNLSIYEDDSAEKALFTGQNVGAGSTTTYDIPPLEKGEYFFRCDLHPTAMTGTATVE